MVNRTALAVFFLISAANSWAAGSALQDARTLAGGGISSYDGGCTGGSCGAQTAVCEDEACRINRAAAGAMKTDTLVVAKDAGARPAVSAEVPAPALGADKDGSKNEPGFFSKMFSGNGLTYGLGGAAAGAGIGWLVGGPIGALIGGLLGAAAGFVMSKMLAK